MLPKEPRFLFISILHIVCTKTTWLDRVERWQQLSRLAAAQQMNHILCIDIEEFL